MSLAPDTIPPARSWARDQVAAALARIGPLALARTAGVRPALERVLDAFGEHATKILEDTHIGRDHDAERVVVVTVKRFAIANRNDVLTRVRIASEFQDACRSSLCERHALCDRRKRSRCTHMTRERVEYGGWRFVYERYCAAAGERDRCQ